MDYSCSKTKLSVRKQTRFKKPPSSSVNNIPVAKKNTNLCLRERTLLNKAYELSTLCDIEVCVIYYGPDGDLIKRWPEDQSKVKDMAERFIKLSDVERRKKSSNLSQFLKKKIKEEKKKSLKENDNKFQNKVLEMEHSLETRLNILQDKLRVLSNHDQTELGQSVAVASIITEQNNNFTWGTRNNNFSTDLPSSDSLMTLPTSLIDDQSRAVHNSGGFATDSSNHNQNNFSIFLYNHDKDTLTQLPDSASSFDLGFTQYDNLLNAGLLGEQGFGGDGTGLTSCSNYNNIPTQNPLVQSWNQTSFYDQMMFS